MYISLITSSFRHLHHHGSQRAVDNGTTHSRPMQTRSKTTRLNVTPMIVKTWEYRENKDAYTNSAREVVSERTPQIDHVVEVALVDKLFARACATHGAPVWTGTQSDVYTVALTGNEITQRLNGVNNLNVTSREVNQKKKGPFASFCNRMRLEEQYGSSRLRSMSLEDLARSGRAKTLVDDGTWARIETCLEASAEDISNWLRERSQHADCMDAASARLAASVADGLERSIDRMDLGNKWR